MKDVRRLSTDSKVSVENALLNVAASQISTSMTKLNDGEVGLYPVDSIRTWLYHDKQVEQ